MKLVALKDAYKAQSTDKGIVSTFKFDNLSDMNDPDQQMRVLLLKPPNSVRLNEDQQFEDYVNYSIEFFVFDLMEDDKGEALAVKWQSIEDDVTAINKGVVNDNDDIREIVSDITMERGHHEHNANLIGIRCTYTLMVFDCLNP